MGSNSIKKCIERAAILNMGVTASAANIELAAMQARIEELENLCKGISRALADAQQEMTLGDAELLDGTIAEIGAALTKKS